MTYEEIVASVKTAYADVDASHITDHVAFQFNVTGEGEGAFYVEIKDGKVNVEPYEYHDRDILVTANADTVIGLANGKIDPVKAYLIGKLKAEGDLGKAAFLKQLSGKTDKKKNKATLHNKNKRVSVWRISFFAELISMINNHDC